jgi:integrase
MVFRRPNRPTWYVQIHTTRGTHRRSTGTSDEQAARQIGGLIDALQHQGDADLVHAVVRGHVAPGELYGAALRGELATLRERVRDLDLEPLVSEWKRVLGDRVSADTRQHYIHAVRSLIPAGRAFPRSALTHPLLECWLADYAASSGTRRKAQSAMSQFLGYLVQQGVLRQNPMREIAAPAPSAIRCRWLDVADMVRLADAQEEPYRTLSALLGGSGLELSIALCLRARDVDLMHREIRAPGIGAHTADRVVRVADWAWPYVITRMALLTPAALLFPRTDRWRARDAHHAACRTLGIDDYHLRDQRHSYAVRAARAGAPAELIARQLGHANAVQVLRVYGPFLATRDERDKWERIASMRDSDRRREREVNLGQCGIYPVYRSEIPVLADRVSSSDQAI